MLYSQGWKKLVYNADHVYVCMWNESLSIGEQNPHTGPSVLHCRHVGCFCVFVPYPCLCLVRVDCLLQVRIKPDGVRRFSQLYLKMQNTMLTTHVIEQKVDHTCYIVTHIYISFQKHVLFFIFATTIYKLVCDTLKE